MSTALSVPRLTLGRAALLKLRDVLERISPEQAPSLLREVGFTAGEALYGGFVASVSERYGVEAPQGLDARYLSDALGGFFRDEGWGTATSEQLARGILAFDSPDWSEADARGAPFPSCHFTTGMLSDFFTRLGGRPAAVLEVECRSRGDARCRFLIGGPEMLNWVYQGLAAGTPYLDLVAGAAR